MARPSDWSPVAMDRDPTPGNPDEVRQLAESLQDFADDVGEALGKIRGMAGERAVLDWAGLSAEAFRAEFDGVPDNLTKLQTSYDMAADALARYWPELQTAQGMADRALERAIAAQADLSAAQAQLTDAEDWVSRAGDEAERLEDEEDAPEPPSEEDVRNAVRDRQAADAAAGAARDRVATAEDNLAAARDLAEQAREMREEAARACASAIDEASDAGIQNRKWWEKAFKWVQDNWDTIVEVCKIIVAVLGVVVMIIGGPLAWVVLAAALIVLADTLVKYAKGQATLLDVAFAALDCIPGMKGLTTAGGLLVMGRNLVTGARRGLGGMAGGVRGMAGAIRGSARMPGGMIPYRALSPKARSLVRRLDADGHIPIRRGEVNVSHMAELQRFNGVEHAIIQNPAGELRLFRGTERTSSIPSDLRGQGYDFIAHTHPEDRLPGPALNDVERAMNQPNSMSRDLEYKHSDHTEVVISRDGQLRFFDGDGIMELPPGVYPPNGPVNDLGFIVPVPRVG
ncbi:WXG100 family type VII secretion target [Streptomyces specialis]|uniref:WXG100 family type VII secretion target n=1 Tax=Streptomyces specialis TaxID=498367 RepID=UPI00073F6F99|nr:WXG100 family type VII secretion target [Streptomyces specialis]